MKVFWQISVLVKLKELSQIRYPATECNPKGGLPIDYFLVEIDIFSLIDKILQ